MVEFLGRKVCLWRTFLIFEVWRLEEEDLGERKNWRWFQWRRFGPGLPQNQKAFPNSLPLDFPQKLNYSQAHQVILSKFQSNTELIVTTWRATFERRGKERRRGKKGRGRGRGKGKGKGNKKKGIEWMGCRMHSIGLIEGNWETYQSKGGKEECVRGKEGADQVGVSCKPLDGLHTFFTRKAKHYFFFFSLTTFWTFFPTQSTNERRPEKGRRFDYDQSGMK